jgi:hypothetical protein
MQLCVPQLNWPGEQCEGQARVQSRIGNGARTHFLEGPLGCVHGDPNSLAQKEKAGPEACSILCTPISAANYAMLGDEFSRRRDSSASARRPAPSSIKDAGSGVVTAVACPDVIRSSPNPQPRQ